MKEFINDLIFVENQDGYTVKEAKDVKEIVIPETFNGKKVTAIGGWAFAGNMKLEKVTIPSTVKSIGGSAFGGCENLKTIIIPKSVETLLQTAFTACNSLTIYCEAETQPAKWHKLWNTWNCPVYWYREVNPDVYGFFWHYNNGEVEVWKRITWPV